MRTLRGLVPAVAVLVAAAGCSLLPGGGGTPAPIRVSVAAAARLNPDEHGESLPTAVRVYQLASSAKARGVELADLLRDPKEMLGEDLLGVDELVVSPGERAEKTVPRLKGARALLVAGIFRRPAGTTWREVVELPASGRRLDLAIALDEYRLERR